MVQLEALFFGVFPVFSTKPLPNLVCQRLSPQSTIQPIARKRRPAVFSLIPPASSWRPRLRGGRGRHPSIGRGIFRTARWLFPSSLSPHIVWLICNDTSVGLAVCAGSQDQT